MHISTVNCNPYSTLLARFDICGFLVSYYPYFVALLHVSHPSSHLHHANAPVPRALFQSAFRIARALQQNPTATADELMSSVDAYVRFQHDANARAIRELNLPDCSGSRFAADPVGHLRCLFVGIQTLPPKLNLKSSRSAVERPKFLRADRPRFRAPSLAAWGLQSHPNVFNVQQRNLRMLRPEYIGTCTGALLTSVDLDLTRIVAGRG